MTSSRSLNLAFIVNLYPPYIVGGNEILARDVIEALRQRGHRVHVLTGHGNDLPADGFTHGVIDIDLDRKADYFLGGLPLTARRVVDWHLFNSRTYQGVLGKLRELQPDLAIAWNLYMASMAPLVAARAYGGPVLAHPADKWLLYGLNDLGALVPAAKPWHRAALTLIRGLAQPVLRRFARPDYILAVSEFIRKLHLAAGYPAAQTRATYLGVPVEQFAYQAPEFPSGRPWRLMFAGQLWAGKGPQVAVEALALLRDCPALPAVELDIYGGGADGFVSYLRDLIHQRGLDDRIRLHGFVPRGQVAEEFGRHDVFLFCSTWDEPFSGGLLEAMARGMPTVASTAGGTPEAITDGQNGLLVPPGQPAALAAALARLMADAQLFARIGEQAATDVRRQWTFDQYIDRLEALYTRIVEQHRPGRPVALADL